MDNVYFCTLWRHHKFVKLLQFDDEVGVYAQFSDVKWARIVMEKGAIIMVHGEDGDETIGVWSVEYKQVQIPSNGILEAQFGEQTLM